MGKSKPIICTLTNEQRAKRGAGWKETLREAGANIAAIPGGVLITFDRESLSFPAIQSLTRAEKACCAWMNFQLEESTPNATLSITSDSVEGAAVIREMTALR